ncbi:MAG: hypothetical protein ABT940_10645, partial [Alphaproteobacteria bacterium]
QNVFSEADVTEWVDIEKSKHFGHFEGNEVDFDDGQEAIMYDANVIGFRATNHGLVPGDFIAVYGTDYYDGHYYVLTYSTAHIVVVWGIYDPEVFTTVAKMRKIISLGPEIDDYGRKQDCKDVVPYVEIVFSDGEIGHVINYADYGLGFAAVEFSTTKETISVTAVHDIAYDTEFLSSMPGPSITPEYETGMPNMIGYPYFNMRRSFHLFDTPAYSHDNPSRGYEDLAGAKWKGKLSTISESEDPEYEGDWTGWVPNKFFDRMMAQPWWTLFDDSDCPWVDLCYRGPSPVKFVIDMGSPRLFSKYRYWIQLWICSNAPLCNNQVLVSKPRTWVIQGSHVGGNNDGDWVTLHRVTDYDPDKFVPEFHPPDKNVPESCAVGDWLSLARERSRGRSTRLPDRDESGSSRSGIRSSPCRH